MADRTFKLTFLGDTTSAVRAVNNLERSFGGLGTASRVASGVAASGMIQNLGAGFTSRLMNSANAASNLTEAMNKSSVVFGDYVSVVQEFGKDSANTFGLSTRAAHEYAGTLGQILRAGGLSQEAAAGMSVELLKLAADMTSFNNIPFDEALEKIRAGLVGETEPLRTVGVLLSAAAVEAKAVELGISDGTRALTEQEKVQARYAIIMEQTASAQGDFARTAEEAANAQRRVAAESENAAAVVGGPTNTAFKILRNAWLEIPPVGREIITVVGLIAGALAIVAAVLPSVITGFGLMAAGGAALAAAVGAISLPVLAVTAAIIGLIAVGYLLWQNWDLIEAKARALAAAIDGVLGKAAATVGLDINPSGTTANIAGAVLPALANVVPGGGAIASGANAIYKGIRSGGIPGFASGGVVPGPVGAPRLAMVHGGETILPTHKGGVGGVTVNVYGSVLSTPAELQRLVVAALNQASQRGELGFA